MMRRAAGLQPDDACRQRREELQQPVAFDRLVKNNASPPQS